MEKYIKIILFVVIIFYVTSLIFREINGDEAIIAEHSYWLSKIGYVKSEMFRGLGFDWEVRQFHYHKLFVITGALSIFLFDISLFALRSISLLSSIIFFIIFYFFIKKIHSFYAQKLFVLLLILFLIQSHFFTYSFLFRPEVMLMLLIFSSFILIEKGKEKQNLLFIISSGVVTGLAVLTHLNGLISIFAGSVILLFNKKYFYTFVFLISSLLISALYFYDISSISDFQFFLFQFKNDPNFSDAHFIWYSPLIRISEEYKRFFHSPKEISLTLLFIFSLIINFKIIWTKYKDLILYLFLLILCLALLTHGKTDKYLLLFIPYIIFIISLSLTSTSTIDKVKRTILYILTVLFVLINTITNINSLIFFNPVNRNKEIAENLEPNSNVFTRETFFFNEIKNFTIHIPMAYELKTGKMKIEKNKKDFFAFAEKNDDRYIALENNSINKHLLKLIEWDSLKETQKLYNYRVKRKTTDYIIFEKEKIY